MRSVIAKQDYLASTLVLTPVRREDPPVVDLLRPADVQIDGGTRNLVRPVRSVRYDRLLGDPAQPESPVAFGTRDDGCQGEAHHAGPRSRSETHVGQNSGPNNLNRVKTGEGDYYEVGGNTVTAQYRPVQPLVERARFPPTGIAPQGSSSRVSRRQDVEPFSAALPASDGGSVPYRAAGRTAGRRPSPQTSNS